MALHLGAGRQITDAVRSLIRLSRMTASDPDAVEKVRGILLERNIIGVDFLNRICALDAYFESILLGASPQNPFSTASTQCRSRGLLAHLRRGQTPCYKDAEIGVT